jgi:hypothetical protein
VFYQHRNAPAMENTNGSLYLIKFTIPLPQRKTHTSAHTGSDHLPLLSKTSVQMDGCKSTKKTQNKLECYLALNREYTVAEHPRSD